MIWGQAAVSFLVWVGYGFWLRGRSELLRARIIGLGRPKRVLLGSIGLLASIAVLLGGLYLVVLVGGVQAGALTPWSWPLVTLLGLGFVHMQVLGATAMITLVQDEETARLALASESKEKNAEPSE